MRATTLSRLLIGTYCCLGASAAEAATSANIALRRSGLPVAFAAVHHTRKLHISTMSAGGDSFVALAFGPRITVSTIWRFILRERIRFFLSLNLSPPGLFCLALFPPMSPFSISPEPARFLLLSFPTLFVFHDYHHDMNMMNMHASTHAVCTPQTRTHTHAHRD